MSEKTDLQRRQDFRRLRPIQSKVWDYFERAARMLNIPQRAREDAVGKGTRGYYRLKVSETAMKVDDLARLAAILKVSPSTILLLSTANVSRTQRDALIKDADSVERAISMYLELDARHREKILQHIDLHHSVSTEFEALYSDGDDIRT
jgi:hypothetical protein